MANHEMKEQNHKNCILLAQKGNDALVMRIGSLGIPDKIIVAYGYKGMETDWGQGSYHDICGGCGFERAMRSALNELYGEDNDVRRFRQKKNRAEEIATHMKDALIDYVNDDYELKEIFSEMKSEIDLDRTEIEFYGLEDYFPRKQYRITLEVREGDSCYWSEADSEEFECEDDSSNIRIEIDTLNDTFTW